MKTSDYLESERRVFALYTLQSRAIPSACDGLKAAGRRVLWIGKTAGKTKTATLAGATLPIHPHATPDSAINTLAAPYGNNIPLFKGYGAFGTMLNPTAYGASRYTSVAVSKFTQDVVFRDIEIIPMTENYDGSLQEPVHFLPLVPVALLNPSEGIAVGFATNILPRALDDIIIAQITHLRGEASISNPTPKFLPIENAAHFSEPAGKGTAYYFKGEITKHDNSSITITKIPYGQTHERVITKITELIEKDIVVDCVDNSRELIEIDVKFKRGQLKDMSEDEILNMMGLIVRHIENLNVLDFTGQEIWSADPVSLIRQFTDWRLGWYIKRYERLRDLLLIDLQKYYDIRCAITNNVGGLAHTFQTRTNLMTALGALGIVYTSYIADLPVYRFTEDERIKNEKKISEAESLLKTYNDLLSSEDKRRKVYIGELQEILSTYTKGIYNE